MGKTKRKKSAAPIFDPIKAKRYSERVKALLVERKALNEDIAEVCSEAKDDGLEPTFIRFAAQESLKDEGERTERDEKRALYLNALGLAVHAVQSGEMSARQAAKIYRIGKSSVYKELAVREVSALASDATGHDAAGNLLQGDADGVIVEPENREADHIAVAAGRPSEPSPPAEQSVKSSLPPERVSLGIMQGKASGPAPIEDASPRACVDGPSAASADPVVPRPATTQAASGDVHRAVTPVPEGGEGTGTDSDARFDALMQDGLDLDEHLRRRAAGVIQEAKAEHRPADAAALRAQIPTSTDPARLEREARHAEGEDDLAFPPFLVRQRAPLPS